MEEEDLYAVLGIEGGGPQVSQQELRKAYRSRALVWHPDKQAGKKPADVASAAVEFEKIQKANEVLSDEKGRKAYDELRNLRQIRLEKEKQYSTKRQKMMQDLRDRERAFENERAEKREEDLATKRLRAEIARIRAENLKKRTKVDKFSTPIARGRPFSSQTATTSTTSAQATEMQNTLNTTLKVSWVGTDDGGSSGYTATQLKEIFEEFGVVEDIVIRSSKSRRKGSALVVMKSKEAAIVATEVPCGDLSNPLSVVPMLPPPNDRREEAFVNSQDTAIKVDSFVNLVGSSYRSYENDVLTKMRRAAERARLIEEIRTADAKTS